METRWPSGSAAHEEEGPCGAEPVLGCLTGMVSDWGATASGLPSANGGLDLEMPAGRYMNPEVLKAELAKGTLSLQTVDDKVRRISGSQYVSAFWTSRSGSRIFPRSISALWPGGWQGIGEILLGHNPESKLPMTFERRLEDNPTFNSYYPDKSLRPLPCATARVCLWGIAITHAQEATLFPFGYGLSYTTFQLRRLMVSGQESASDPAVAVAFDLTNTGDRKGTEVP